MNKYVWELYLKSGGNKTVSFFRNNFEDKFKKNYVSGIKKLQKVYCVFEDEIEDTEIKLTEFVDGLDEIEIMAYYPEDSEYMSFRVVKTL